MRDRFTFFRSYGEALENLPDDERLKCYDAIYRYAIFGEEPELDGIAKGFFTLMKPNIDKSIKRAEAGKLGGESDTNDNQNESKPKAKDKQNESKEEPNCKNPASDKDKDKDKDKEKVKKEKFSDVPELQQAFEDFSEMRTRIKRPLTGRAITLLKNNLAKLSDNPLIQARILDQSTFHSWQSVYELKDDSFQSQINNNQSKKPSDKNAGLEKRINPPEDETDVEAMRMYDEDRERHRWQDGWLINDDGYWIKRNGIV